MKKALLSIIIVAFAISGFTQNSSREQFPPPQELYYFNMEPDYVEFNWNVPTIENWIHWDEGNIVVYIQYGPNTTGMIASRWDTASLEPYIGRYLKSIRFVPAELGVEYTLKVWKGENAASEILSQSTSNLEYGTWNEVELTDSIFIDGVEELWFGFEFEYGSEDLSSVTLDDGSNTIDGYGNMLFMNGSWQTMLSTGMEGNWNLTGVLNTNVAMNRSQNRSINTLIGYNLYKDDVKISGPFPETYEYDYPEIPGIYEYYVTALYDDGESDPSNKVTVYWLTTSIDDKNSLSIHLFPNPATSKLNVQIPQPVKQIKIINTLGRVVYWDKKTNLQNNISIDVSDFANGTYIVLMYYEDKTISEQFIIHK